MSDVNIAPPPSSAPSAPSAAPSSSPASAPSRTEVTVNPNPVHTPAPVGSQAPPKSVGDLKGSTTHPVSRREAARESIRQAFAKTKPPGMGHNQPPEPMKREARQEPINLRKRPDDQASAPLRERGDHGHFAPNTSQPSSAGASRGQQADRPGERAGQPAPSIQGAQGGNVTPPPNVTPLPPGAPYAQPPKRWDRQAQAEWAAAPESVRANVYRMGQEYQRAYQQTRGELEAHNTVKHYHQMAQQHGTTLVKALDNYVGMENKLRQDPVAGLDVIVQNLNLRTPQGQRLGLRDVAWHVLNLTPEGQQATQMRNMQSAQMQKLAEVQQQNATLAEELRRMQYRQEYRRMHRGVNRFAESHPRLDELGDLIEREIHLGFGLKEAYRRAELLRPAGGSATQAAQTRTATAQTRTRSTDRSIRGAPDSGSLSNGRWSGPKPVGRRDIIANAIKQVGGSL